MYKRHLHQLLEIIHAFKLHHISFDEQKTKNNKKKLLRLKNCFNRVKCYLIVYKMKAHVCVCFLVVYCTKLIVTYD